METCCFAVPPRRFEPITTMVCWPGSSGSVKCRNAAIRRNIRYWLPVNDQRCTRLRSPDNFRHSPVNLRALNFQHHVLRFGLRHQRELECFAELASLLFSRPTARDVPEIVARIQSRIPQQLVPETFTSFTSFVNIVVELIRNV